MPKFICSCHNQEFKDRHNLNAHLWHFSHKEKSSQNNKKWCLENNDKTLTEWFELHPENKI